MSKYQVTCTITYQPERVFEWAADLEKKRRAQVPVCINPGNGPYRQKAVLASAAAVSNSTADGGTRTNSNGTATSTSEVDEISNDNTDKAEFAVARIDTWLAKPFPKLVDVLGSDDVAITLITDLMHFTASQVEDLDAKFSQCVRRLGDRAHAWQLIVNRISQFCAFEDSIESNRGGVFRCQYQGLPRIRMREQPNELHKTNTVIKFNEIVKVSAIVTGSGIEYLKLADHPGYFPVVLADSENRASANFHRVETYRCISSSGVGFHWNLPTAAGSPWPPQPFLDRPELRPEQLALINALIEDYGLDTATVSLDQIRDSVTRRKDMLTESDVQIDPNWFIGDTNYHVKRGSEIVYKLPPKIGHKYVVALSAGSQTQVGLTSSPTRSAGELWDIIRSLVRVKKSQKIYGCSIVVDNNNREYVPLANIFPGFYKLIRNGCPLFEKFNQSTMNYQQYDIQNRCWLEPTVAKVGDRVQVTGYLCTGTVKFVGYQRFVGPRVGVVMDDVVESSCHTRNVQSYFDCQELHGILVAAAMITIVDIKPITKVRFADASSPALRAQDIDRAQQQPAKQIVSGSRFAVSTVQEDPVREDSVIITASSTTDIPSKAGRFSITKASQEMNETANESLPVFPGGPKKLTGRFAITAVPSTPRATQTPAGNSESSDKTIAHPVESAKTEEIMDNDIEVAAKSIFKDAVSRILHKHELHKFKDLTRLASVLAEEFDNPTQLQMLTNSQALELDILLKDKGFGIRSRAIVSQLCSKEIEWPNKIRYLVRQGFVDHFTNRLNDVLADLSVDPKSIAWDDADVPGTSRRALHASFTVKFENIFEDLNLNATATELNKLSKEFLQLKQHLFLLLAGGVDTELTVKQVETGHEATNLEKSKAQKFRLSFAEINLKIRLGAQMNIDFLVFTFAAAIIAAVGLGRDDVVSTVASMLISPLMGPIMGMTFGGVVKDARLTLVSLKNEAIGLGICLMVGFVTGLIFSQQVHDYDWPSPSMEGRGDPIALLVGLAIAIPSGLGVALSITAANTSGLVGVAISASLLPPAVNAGMCWGLAVAAPAIDRYHLAETGLFSLMLTLVNIVIIIIVGTAAFRFRTILPGKQPELVDFSKTLNAARKEQESIAQQFYDRLKETRKSPVSRFLSRKKSRAKLTSSNDVEKSKGKSSKTSVDATPASARFVPPIRLVFDGVVIGSDNTNELDHGPQGEISGEQTQIRHIRTSKAATFGSDAGGDNTKLDIDILKEREDAKTKRLHLQKNALLARVNECVLRIAKNKEVGIQFTANDIIIEVQSASEQPASVQTPKRKATVKKRESRELALNFKKTHLSDGEVLVNQNVLIHPPKEATTDLMERLVRELQHHKSPHSWPYGRVVPKIQLVQDGSSEGDTLRRATKLFGILPKSPYRRSLKSSLQSEDDARSRFRVSAVAAGSQSSVISAEI